MPVIFEKSKSFHTHVDEFYIGLAERHLIGKTFDSIDDALAQEINEDGTRLSEYFKIRSKSPRSKNLEKFPSITSEVDLEGICKDERGVMLHNQPNIALSIVIAKYTEYSS